MTTSEPTCGASAGFSDSTSGSDANAGASRARTARAAATVGGGRGGAVGEDDEGATEAAEEAAHHGAHRLAHRDHVVGRHRAPELVGDLHHPLLGDEVRRDVDEELLDVVAVHRSDRSPTS